MKKLISMFLALILVVGLIPASVLGVSAAEPVYDAAENVSWSYASETGTLTVRGEGAIPNYFCTYDDELRGFADQIRSIVIQEGITQIGEFAFGELPALTSVTLPTSLRVIDSEAFWDCANLSSSNLNEGPERIGHGAFKGTGLRRIAIPASVTEIEEIAFWLCSDLESIAVAQGNESYSGDARGVLFNREKTTLIQAPQRLAGSYEIPDTVDSFALYAFYGCAALTEITLPSSVKVIDPYSFGECSALERATFHEGLQQIDAFAFMDCVSLREIRIPASVSDVGAEAFCGCVSLERYIVDPANNTYVSDAAGALYDHAMTTLLHYPAGRGGAYTVPEGVERISFAALNDCGRLTKLELPSTLLAEEYIGTFFYDCAALREITVSASNPWYSADRGVLYNKDKTELIRCPKGFEGSCEIAANCRKISMNGFYGCAALTEVILPEGLEEIGDLAFFDCTSMPAIRMPASVTSIMPFSLGFYSSFLELRGGGAVRVKGFSIYGYPDTVAEAYADEFNFDFYDLSTWEEGKTEFDDVSPNAYYARPVHWAVWRGIVTGTGEGTFSPKKACTRAEIVTMLWRAMGSPEPETAETLFEDVNPSAWYAKAVAWAVEAGITAGTSATTFSPKQPCTRAQVVTFLWKALTPYEYGDDPENPFTDVNPNAWYARAVAWAVRYGITAGTSETTFSPNQPCTRAQVVTFFWAVKERYSSSFGMPQP